MSRRAALVVAMLLVVHGCTRAPAPRTTPGGGSPPPSSPVATAPATPSPSPEASTVRFAAVGDIGEVTPAQRGVAERIVALHRERALHAVLLLGDIIYPDGDGARYEERFGQPWRGVLEARIPLYAALGNHDVQTRDGADVMARFGMPGRWYDFRIGPVAFFAVDSNRLTAEQTAWLDARLGASDAPWRVVFLHEPPYSSGRHGSSLRAQRALAPIVKRHGVQLVLAGHDHDYERTIPIEGTVYVVAGIGCCVRPVGSSSFTATAASTPGVVVVEASNSAMVVTAVAADGGPVDRFTLERAETGKAA